jgi:hypothetical protein
MSGERRFYAQPASQCLTHGWNVVELDYRGNVESKRGPMPEAEAHRVADQLEHARHTKRDPMRTKTTKHSKKSAKFEQCVTYVKRSGRAVNPFAVCHAAIKNKAYRKSTSRDEVLPSRKDSGVERDMNLGFLDAVWVDAYMDWTEENGLGWMTGHIPQHVRDLDDIPQRPPEGAKKLARKYASLLVKMNRASLTQIWERASKAEGGAVDPRELAFYLAMQSRGHGISWVDSHAVFKVVLPSAEWYAYGKKGHVQVEGNVSEQFPGGLQ